MAPSVSGWINPLNKFIRKQWPLISIGIVLVIVLIFLLRAGRVMGPSSLIKDILSDDGLRLKDIHYIQDDPEKGFNWILDAVQVKISNNKKIIIFQEVDLELDPKNGSWFKLKSNKGKYSRDTGEINLWGDVEGISSNGYRAMTEHLLINEKTENLTTDKHIKIWGPFFFVEGQGFFADLQSKQMKILSDVTAIVERGSFL